MKNISKTNAFLVDSYGCECLPNAEIMNFRHGLHEKQTFLLLF